MNHASFFQENFARRVVANLRAGSQLRINDTKTAAVVEGCRRQAHALPGFHQEVISATMPHNAQTNTTSSSREPESGRRQFLIVCV